MQLSSPAQCHGSLELLCDISPYKGMGKEGKVKERREREREKREKGTTKENKFAGTGETTRARRESVEKRFLAV